MLQDYAILMLLAKLGLRATLTSMMLTDDPARCFFVRLGSERECRCPSSWRVIAHTRDRCPTSSPRRLFLGALAPHVGFGSVLAAAPPGAQAGL